MTYTRECKKCGKSFEAHWYNVKRCPACAKEQEREESRKYRVMHRGELAAKARARRAADPDFRRKNAEKSRKWYAAHHPKLERFCPECGKKLEDSRAQRCPDCAKERHRQQCRERRRRIREEKRAKRPAMMHKKSEVKRMDDAATLAKKAHVKIEKSHRVRDDDARQRAAQERKRIAAGVDMLKEIYARRQAEKKW